MLKTGEWRYSITLKRRETESGRKELTTRKEIIKTTKEWVTNYFDIERENKLQMWDQDIKEDL